MATDRNGVAVPDAVRLIGVSQVVAVDSTAKQITAVNTDARAVRVMGKGGDCNLHLDSTVDSNDFLLLENSYQTFEVDGAKLWATAHLDSIAVVLRVTEIG